MKRTLYFYTYRDLVTKDYQSYFPSTDYHHLHGFFCQLKMLYSQEKGHICIDLFV